MSEDRIIWDEADAVTGFADARGLDLADWQERLLGSLFGTAPDPPEPRQDHLVPPLLADDVAVTATKMTACITVSNDLLMDWGVIPDTRPRPVITRRERFRRWRHGKISGARFAVAGRAYRLISGEDVPEPEW